MSLSSMFRLIRVQGLPKFSRQSFSSLSFRMQQFWEHTTPRKFINRASVKAQKWVKRDKVSGMPFLYVIDPTNACNLRCRLCPTGLGTLGRPRGLISLENYQKIIDEIAPYAYDVVLFNWGEPFLHPQIFDIIKYASEKRIAVRVSSNLNRFSREMAKKTVESGLDKLLISVDGASQDVYESYRKGGKLEVVLQNIRWLVEAKRELNSTKPFIYFKTLINRYNEGQIDEMCRLADDLGVDAFRAGPIFIDTTNSEQVKEWLPEKSQISAYNTAKNQEIENVYHCADLWESMTINWDGGVAPCCWLHEKSNDFSNVFDKSVREIWNGDAYISSRRVFAFGGAKSGPQKTICTRCKGKPLYLKD